MAFGTAYLSGAEKVEVSPWSRFISLRSAPGYKDNVTYSSQNRERSAFWLNGGDVFLLRTPADGPQLSFFVMGEDVRYFSSSVDDEQLGIVTAEISQKIGEDWKASLMGLGSYTHGVFDASSTTTNRVVQVKAYAATVRPQIIRYLPNATRVELRFDAIRQYFNEPLDDYWEGGPRLLFGWVYRKNSDLTLSYAYRERAYDRRNPLSLAGFSMPGGLRLEQHEIDVQWTHTFDEARKWRLVSKAGYERNLDNGEGYFDYHRVTASQGLRFRAGDFQAEAKLTFAHYDYDHQPAAVGGAEARRRTLFGGGIEARYDFTTNWSVYGEWLSEDNASNDPFDEYQANSVSLGVEWNF